VVSQAKSLSFQLVEFFNTSGKIVNSLDMLLQPHEISDSPRAVEQLIEDGSIEFRDVTFGYPGKAPIFCRFNLHIPAGQTVGIAGYSGSGKSTLLGLLLRLYDPQEGNILIHGADIRTMPQISLRRQIAVVPQEPQLFHRSLRENIGYGDIEASFKQIVAAARTAHAHSFIASLPEGYDTLVGERGVKLSGGQRQRVAMARALLKKAPICSWTKLPQI
jgi:ATP-binding cassette subfamily B protein